MSTMIFESASVEHLKDESPQRPWRRKPTKFTVSVFLAVVVPGVIVAWLFFFCTSWSDYRRGYLPTPSIVCSGTCGAG